MMNKKYDMTAIVWRKSVYENNYVCACGKRLFSEGEGICEDVLFDINEKELICPKCYLNVAKVVDVQTAKDMGAIEVVRA